MSDVFRFDDPLYPVPPEAAEANSQAFVRELIQRVVKSERALAEQRAQTIARQRDLFLDLVAVADDVSAVVERYGVTSNAREAAIIRSVVALGKKLFETLRQQGVEPVNALGEMVDPETSDVVGSEAREGAPPGRVLREVQVGYTWPYGLLRRARVITGAESAGEPDAAEDKIEDVAAAEPPAPEGADDQAVPGAPQRPQE